VCCAEFFYGQGDKLFLWLAFDEDRPLFFCVFARAFFSLKKVPVVTPQDWLQGTKWDGMPYHVTLGHPGWWITAAQVEVR
jgi:hypothetical protein